MIDDQIAAALGRVVVQGTTLDYVLAFFAYDAGECDSPGELMTAPGAASRAARKAIERLAEHPQREELPAWVNDAEALRRERHSVVHSLTLMTLRDSGQIAWEAFDFKLDAGRQLDATELDRLALRIGGCAIRPLAMGFAVPSRPAAQMRMDDGASE
jgi:hypothetical protein